MRSTSIESFEISFGTTKIWLLAISIMTSNSCSQGNEEEEEKEVTVTAVTKAENKASTNYVRTVTRLDLTEDEKKLLEVFESGVSVTGTVAGTNVPEKNYLLLNDVEFVQNQSALALKSMLPKVNVLIMPYSGSEGSSSLKQGDTIKEDLNVATLSDLSLTGDFLALVEGTTRIEPKRSTSDESTSLTFCPSVVALLQSSPCKVVTNLKVDNKIVTVAENVNCSTTQNSVGLDATSGCIPDFNSKIQCIGTGCGNGKIIASSETNNVQEFSKEWLCKYFDRPEATVPLSMMNEFESCLMDKKNNKSSDMETETSNVEDDMCKYLVRKASNGTLHPSLSMQLNACTNTNPNLASTPAYSTPQQIIYAPMTPASSSTNSSSNSIALPQGAPQTAATATVSTESASFLTPLEAAPLTAPSVSAIDNE